MDVMQNSAGQRPPRARGGSSVDKVTFVADDKTMGLSWMVPSHAPDLTDDQARTMAIAQLGFAMEKLAVAVERLAHRTSG